MVYQRTQALRQADRADSLEWEAVVAEALGPWIHSRTDSTTELDYWWPGFLLDAKEKKQKLTERWHLLPGVEERDLFVIDELSIRKALTHYPAAYFVVRDRPGERLFLASVGHVAVADRVRVQRAGKGKWIVNLATWRQIARLEDIPQIIQAELVSMPWKRSECLSLAELPPQI